MPSEDDINDSMAQAQLSMLTSFENYYFYTENSVLSNYMAAERLQEMR